MGKFVPQDWVPKEKDIQWGIETFNVEKKEVLRQLELMRDHEFRRSYTDWNRVFRNWLRKCEELETFRRQHRRQPEQVTEDMLQEDRKRWEEDMRRLGVSVVGNAARKSS